MHHSGLETRDVSAKGSKSRTPFKDSSPSGKGITMKQKTHSGAKKRFRVKSRTKIKRGKQGLRHILSNKSSKRKRHLGDKTYVHSANLSNIQSCLNL